MYDAGQAALAIVPTFRGVQQTIAAEAKKWASSIESVVENALPDALRAGARNAGSQGNRAGSDYGGSFADTVKARIDAAFRSLPKAKPGLDTSEVDAKVESIRAELDALRDVRVGVDISADEALARVDELQMRLAELSQNTPDVQVRVDAARAAEELAGIQAEVDRLDGRDVNIRVHESGDASGIGGLLGGGLSGGSGLMDIGMGLGPALAPIAAAGTAGLAGIATVAASGAAGLGTLVLGLNGVTSAVQAVGKAHDSTAEHAGQSAAAQMSAANQVRSAEASLANTRAQADSAAVRAAEQVRNARQSLADTERQVAAAQAAAARQVVDAEHNLAAAAQASADAQQRLNDAREQAARDLESMANQAVDAHLAQQQAILDVTTATQHLADVNANSASTDVEKQQAALDLAKAQQSLVEANQRAAETSQDNAAAQAAGVAGSPAVVSATRAVADAQAAQQQAAQHLTDAQAAQRQQQITGAEQISRAEQSLADALRAQRDQQRQSAFAVAQAEQGVTSAMLNQQRAATTASTANNAAALALSKLTPEGRQFAGFVATTLLPAFSAIRDVAQTNLLPGLEEGIKAAMPLMPAFTRFIGGLATVMGDLFTQAGRALTSPFWRQFFGYVAATAGPTLSTLAHVLGGMAQGFAGLLEAFAPVVTQLGTGLATLADNFANFGAGAANGGIQGFIGFIQREGPVVADVFGQIATLVGHLLTAFAPLGAVLLQVIDVVLRFINTLSPQVLFGIAAALMLVFGGPVTVIATFVGLMVLAYDHSATFRRVINDIAADVMTVVGPALQAFRDHWPDIVAALSGALTWISVHVGPVLTAMAGLFSAVVATVQDLWNRFGQHLIDHLQTAMSALGEILSGAFKIIQGIFEVFTGLLTGDWSKLWQGLSDIVDGIWKIIQGTVRTAINLVSTIIGGEMAVVSEVWSKAWRLLANAASGIWDGISGGVKGMWADIKGFFVDGINDVIGFLDWFIDKVDAVLGFFHLPKVPHLAKLSTGGSASGGGGGGSAHPIYAATGAVIPGYAPGVDSVLAMVSPGEAILRPEVTRWLGADMIHGLNRAARFGHLPRFKDGGILGSIGSVVGGVVGDITDIGKSILGIGADATMKAIETAAHPLLNHLPAGMFRELAASLFDSIDKAIKDMIGGQGDQGAHGASAAAAQRMAAGLLPQFGWDGSQMPPLIALWNRESGWRWDATNPTSGAYGIPQSLPASKMASAGADWRTNPLTQILWGLGYIGNRYGSPAAAEQHEIAFNWYDQGGYLPVGMSIAMNGTGRPEPVGHHLVDAGSASRGFSDDQFDQLLALLEDSPVRTGAAVGEAVGDRFERATVAHANRVDARGRKGIG